MPKQNKPLRHPHAAGKLYKVAVSILHYSRADHPCIPGPFDKHICKNYILDIDPQEGHHRKHHNLTRKREHHIHQPHDYLFHNPPKISRRNPQNSPQTNRSRHCHHGKSQSRPYTVYHSGQHAPPQLIRSQRIFPAVIRKFIKNIRSIGIIGSDPWSKNPHKSNDCYHSHGRHGSFIM